MIRAELLELAHVSNWANFTVTCAIFHHIQQPPQCTRRGTAMWMISHGEDCTRGWEAWIRHTKNTFNSPSRTLFKKKTYSYSVSSSTITCLSIANQSRAANPNRQSSKVASKNTSLALSQLQPIREGTYVAKLHRAPRGYANVQDLPHDLPSFLSCKPCWCDKPCMEKHRDTGSQCASECSSFVRRVIKCSPNNQHSNFGDAKGSIKLFW